MVGSQTGLAGCGSNERKLAESHVETPSKTTDLLQCKKINKIKSHLSGVVRYAEKGTLPFDLVVAKQFSQF